VHVRPPKLKDFDRLWRASENNILYTTLAPELPGAEPYIRDVVERGCVVSLGHHNATAQQIHAAVEAGARLSTHLGNGAHPKMQRHFNPLWPQLAEDRLMASLIADLHHLPEPVLKSFVRCKGVRNTILVSDSVHLAGMKPGVYELFGGKVQLHANGKITIPGTGLLAGSGLMLVQGVLNVARCTDLSLKQAIACATSTPARLLGLRSRGRLPQVGRKANFCLVSGQGTNVKMLASFVDGKRAR
jgi:N-acetylglucosamine-6-phosphate deacetylase